MTPDDQTRIFPESESDIRIVPSTNDIPSIDSPAPTVVRMEQRDTGLNGVNSDTKLKPDSEHFGTSSWERRYQLIRKIGEGGFGVVYLARDTVLLRDVALKFIRIGSVSDALLDRFFQEARSVAKLAHPNIVTLFGIHPGDHPGDAPFIDMEYVDGTDLASVVRVRGPLDVWQSREYVRMVALGLQHAHERGLVHRDIKPYNLMLTSGNTVKILDFGLAKLLPSPIGVTGSNTTSAASSTGVGTNPFVLPSTAHDSTNRIVGTPQYMAPEQWASSNVDIRADIYALGCTFYFLLTGAPVFSGIDMGAIERSHRSEEPIPIEVKRPDIPRSLAAVIKRMMAKSPDDRYQTPADLILALDRLLQPTDPPPVGKLRTADEVVGCLRSNLLIDDRQLDEVELSLSPLLSEASALLGELRVRNWLTDFQCGEILAGRGSKLNLGGNYVLIKPIGEGAIGKVFLALPRFTG